MHRILTGQFITFFKLPTHLIQCVAGTTNCSRFTAWEHGKREISKVTSNTDVAPQNILNVLIALNGKLVFS